MTRYLFSLAVLLALLLPVMASAAPLKKIQNAATAADDGLTFDVQNDTATVGLTVSGTFVATITFKGSSDAGANWDEIYCTRTDTDVSATATTITGQFLCPVAGLTGLIADITAYTSGSVTVTAYPSKGGGVATGGGVDTGLLTSMVSILTDAWDTVNHALSISFATLFYGEDSNRDLIMTGGGLAGQTVIATAMVVGGDGTFKAAQPGWNGPKTFSGRITGTGSISQTIKIYGGYNSSMTLTNSKEICRLTLAGTTEAFDICKSVKEDFTQIGVVTSVTLGTGTSGEVMMGIE